MQNGCGLAEISKIIYTPFVKKHSCKCCSHNWLYLLELMVSLTDIQAAMPCALTPFLTIMNAGFRTSSVAYQMASLFWLVDKESIISELSCPFCVEMVISLGIA